MRNGVIVSIKSQMKDVQSSLNRLFAHKTIIFWFSLLEINSSMIFSSKICNTQQRTTYQTDNMYGFGLIWVHKIFNSSVKNRSVQT